MSKKMKWIGMEMVAALLVAGVAPALAAYEVDGGHSSVIFRVKHLGVSYFYGQFTKISGSFDVDADKPESTIIDVEIAADSIDTKMDKLTDHLKSADFFSVQEFPKITFKSKSAKAGKDGNIEVTGDLSLHGKTKSITVTVEPVGKAEGDRMGARAGFECIFTIKRSDYGMDYMTDKLGDDVRVIVSLEGRQ